ncbi:TIM-barrel domain-containing protein [Paenibacillus thermoaerophilus]|uniref:TIM-barrel domain-containing protein n=1 Tax=Paenibacillus thermoaerophilus TaxID=1215385 RepID=A0ABW2UZJ9_9BACL|nr:TIM-barrel domain-containing protein [Paenibacillus thermoaerophilus]TMV17375.1 hypothetical protein FE781_07770 [Paenibacillus thermoaerophilus]
MNTSRSGTIPLWTAGELNVREAAYMNALHIRSGNAGACEAFVASASRPEFGRWPLLDKAYWLWAAGEYASALKDREQAGNLLFKLQAPIAETVALLEKDWRIPARHWLCGGGEAVYLSNLAIVYGALLAMQPHAYHAAIQKVLKNIRELVFEKFIKEGRLISVLGSRSIHGDIVLAAVPFGMLGIEDRILIEALMKVEERLIGKGVRFDEDDLAFGGCERFDLTALLAWYYAEKGDVRRAKQLASHAEAHLQPGGELPEFDLSTARESLYLAEDLQRCGDRPPVSRLGAILLALAGLAIARQAAAGDQAAATAAVRVLHEPTGKDDPYVTLNCERIPRHPEEHDRVRVRAVTEPFRPDQQVYAEVSVNGGPYNGHLMRPERTAEGDNCWEGDIGRFVAGDTVTYRFRAVTEQGEAVSSEYGFHVLKWHALEQVRRCVRLSDSEAIIELASRSGGLVACLEIAVKGPRTVAVSLKPGAIDAQTEIQACSDGAIELQAGPGHTLRIESRPFRLTLLEEDAIAAQTYVQEGIGGIEVLAAADGSLRKVRLNFRLHETERFFGTGERYSHIEFRGLDIDHYVHNEYRSQGLKTYIPVPFVISNRGYGLFLDTPLYSKFRFGTALSDQLAVEANVSGKSQTLQCYLLVGEPMDVISAYTALSGRPELPPKWSFGPWISSNNWDSQREVEKQAELAKRYGIPSTVIVLEQWSDEATFYIFNDAQYEPVPGGEALRYDDFEFPEWGRWPDPKRMVEELHKQGMKVLLWQIPIQKYLYGAKHEQKDADERFMLENGYHVRHADGRAYRIPYNWFKDCLVIDFTNEAAARWWFEKRAYLLDEIGIDGFKTDGGECIFGNDLLFADGSTGAEMRNLYPNLYIGAYYREVQRKTGGDGITFSRAGYTGAQRYPLHWAGDERSTYEAFRSSLNAGLSAGMSGIPFWGWDLAGFHGDIPTAELFLRSTQMAAFCPVMQLHAETKGEFNQDRTPWNIAERTGRPEVISIYKKYADLRMNLLPYIYEQARISSRDGVPLMRAMFAAFPRDPRCVSMNGQYMFGERLLVAPVLEEGAYSKQVYIPEGSWISLFDERQYEGPAAIVLPVELDEIPVFLQADGVLPLNLDDTCQLASHVGNRVDGYDRLCLMAYPRKQIDYSFRDGLDREIGLRIRREAGQLRLEADIPRGGPDVTLILKGLDPVRTVEEWSDTAEPSVLTIADGPDRMDAGEYCCAGGKLYIRLARSVKLRIPQPAELA